MDSLSSKHPLLILRELELQYTSNKTPATSSRSEKAPWTGVAIELANERLLIENRYVEEILLRHAMASLSQVPGTKDWFKGLTSVHGQALPVVDLGLFLFKRPTKITNNSRLLILDFGDFSNAVLLEKSLGLKHFADIPQFLSNASSEFLQYSFQENQSSWPILDVDALGRAASFRNTALEPG